MGRAPTVSPLLLQGDPTAALGKKPRRREPAMSSNGQDAAGRCSGCGRPAGMVSGASSFSYRCRYCDGLG